MRNFQKKNPNLSSKKSNKKIWLLRLLKAGLLSSLNV